MVDLTNFRQFFSRFGGSVRTKHVSRWWPFSWKRTLYSLPYRSGIPKGYIRLCPWEAEFVFSVARRAKLGIVEVGRFNGGSTFLMACANPRAQIHSVDIAPRDDELLRSIFKRHGVGANVDLIVGDSQQTKYDHIKPVDLLFIDGDHSYAGCSADIRNWFDLVVPGGYVLFHDSYLGNSVQDAILDFIESRNDLEVVVSPMKGRRHWRYPTGSLALLRRTKDASR